MSDSPSKPDLLQTADGRTTTKRRGGPVALTARMLTMIDRMVHGHPDDSTHTPYGLYDAAKAVGYQRKAARHLARSGAFVDAYYRALAGKTGPAVMTLAEVQRALERLERERASFRVRNSDAVSEPKIWQAPGYIIKHRSEDGHGDASPC